MTWKDKVMGDKILEGAKVERIGGEGNVQEGMSMNVCEHDMNKYFLCMRENGDNEWIYGELESGLICKEIAPSSVRTLFDI